MAASISNSRILGSRNFDLLQDRMLQAAELPLAEVLDGNPWPEIFDAHEIVFGNDEEAIYTPAVTLWALISQVFFNDELRSCKTVVGRVASRRATLGKHICSTRRSLLSRSSQDLVASRSRCLLQNRSNLRSDFTIQRTSILNSCTTMLLRMRRRFQHSVASSWWMASPSRQLTR